LAVLLRESLSVLDFGLAASGRCFTRFPRLIPCYLDQQSLS